MKHPAENLTIILFLCFCSLVLSAQEKTQAYYNRHEKEIIPDATDEFKKGNYERTIELCKWHYIIVGDNAADSLREMAERCAQLTKDINSIKTEAEDKIKDARLLAVSLLSVNSNDTFAKVYLQWSERTLNDTLSAPIASYLLLQDTEPLMDVVDLGLSVKWASCNLGASRPEEMGDYYAWGETAPKTDSTFFNSVWENYKWCKGTSESFTKYCWEEEYGFVDRRDILMLEDDVAHVERGSSWRMPTEKEMTELMRKCIWIWTRSSGVDGFKIISTINGNSIFLPLSNYWTSSLSRGKSYGAMALRIFQDSYKLSSVARYNASVVRPVLGK